MKYICVFGSSSEAIERSYLDTAEELGRMLAARGCGVVYGAGRYGIMGAVSRGVRAENGALIGVSPDFFVDLNVLVKDYGVVICAGGIGTLEEFFEVITLKQLGRHDKPIILLNTNGFYDPMIDMMEQSVAQRFISDKVHKLYSVAQSVDEVLEQLDDYKPFAYNKYKE